MNIYKNLQIVWFQFVTNMLLFVSIRSTSNIYWFIGIRIRCQWIQTNSYSVTFDIRTIRSGIQWTNPKVKKTTICRYLLTTPWNCSYQFCNIERHQYHEQSSSETTVYFQSDLFNDAVSSNQRSIYAKLQQSKKSGELMEKEGEGEKEQRINRVRDGALDRNRSDVGQKWPIEKLNTWVFCNSNQLDK